MAGRRALPLRGEVAPDPGRRRSDTALVEASVTARLLGMRILTLDATVALVPAEVRVATPPVPDRAAHVPAGSPGDARGRAVPVGPRLADAVRNLDEGARLLAEVQRDGS